MPLKELRVDGGASRNNLLMQTQADILGVPVVRPKVTETTALGAAYLAGLAVGYWDSIEQIGKQWKADRTFEPTLSADERAEQPGPLETGRRTLARLACDGKMTNDE